MLSEEEFKKQIKDSPISIRIVCGYTCTVTEFVDGDGRKSGYTACSYSGKCPFKMLDDNRQLYLCENRAFFLIDPTHNAIPYLYDSYNRAEYRRIKNEQETENMERD